jgi:hypothetical protein
MWEDKPVPKPRITAGIIVSAIWFGATAVYVFVFKGVDKFSELDPNSMGDFFAGFAAPLAFLWLVLGYLQQGEELELQRKELELQRKEIERLAGEAKRQATAIEANELHARRDTFLRAAELIIAELNSLAARILGYGGVAGDRMQREFWPLHGAGNRYVFFDSAISISLQGNVAEFTNRVNARPHRKKNIDRYILVFEKLITQAQQCDPDESLRATFELSPMGTLYAGLCIIYKHEQKFHVRPQVAELAELN